MTRRRWLVTGAAGMLGTDLVRVLREAGAEVTALGRDDLDLLQPSACVAAFAGHDVVVNCAAYTAVDRAESEEAQAFSTNAVAAANIAHAAVASGARLVQVSTDYVFAGDASTPYAEDALLAPRSAYGRTKAAGEWAVRSIDPTALVVRVAWLYGAHGPNFAKTMARLAGERETLTVVGDQIGQPTWTVDVCRAVVALVDAGQSGPFHATNAGEVSWAGFAKAIFEGLGLDPERVRPITTAEYPLPAPRPAYSVLGHDRWTAAGLPGPRPWQEALGQALPTVIP